ncbi:tetraacyldisaccharide 4'-kinase [Christiangramia sabulilitoris]|uniref:Tetraacyldisaccharide 4'-kinase n=1 Tax=Christiangramia sabulilitoris TaxID=2583991 RepID=A0A550I3L9_9FLAO|nr:tetraacyldisaccharide 4'-kinase [Christiangramia sabulilitoris]TRO65573.1 tetraacyldisaccharide 4'-kinase [Christiangramia sabulilitoris]
MPNPRKLLYPFSLIYHGVTRVRNKLYDNNILKFRSYDLPVIAVGNLNMGGTGKSPMIEFLLRILNEHLKVATLSRGYKRESKGFQLVAESDSVSKSGDEPLQFKNKYPDVIVAVDADRQEGIRELLKFKPDVILLDDAFQHRKVKAGFYILLTAYGDLFVDDLILPAGNLRESSSGARRADVIIVTKCPNDLSEAEQKKICNRLKPESHQAVFFSSIKYSDNVISKVGERSLEGLKSRDFVLVTGIANPAPLLEFLKSKNFQPKHYKFSDHHNFSKSELEQLQQEPAILTTEKDYMRLRDKIPAEKLYYLPIEVEFLERGEKQFTEKIKLYVNKKEV